MENKLYPLKFNPILKDKIWGGSKLKTILNKTDASDKCGESWEISSVPGDISVVSEGWLKGNSLEELIEIYMGDLVGDKVFEKFGTVFPLLIKFIDANADLSIQVHPNDEVAKERHDSYGKTEMWYIVDAEKDASLIVGFEREVSKQEYLEKLDMGQLPKIMKKIGITNSEVFFIPAGRIHAICSGTVLAEIQQTSDITYRIYDYERMDDHGNQRELHTDLALDVIDFKYHDKLKTDYSELKNQSAQIVECEYFTTNIISAQGKINRDFGLLDSFIIYMCVEGNIILKYNGSDLSVAKGETVLVPAIMEGITLESEKESKLLEVYIK